NSWCPDGSATSSPHHGSAPPRSPWARPSWPSPWSTPQPLPEDVTATRPSPPGPGTAAPVAIPVGRWWRPVVLASVAACAACGLIYELALITLATTVQGGGIVATSLIVAGYVAEIGRAHV